VAILLCLSLILALNFFSPARNSNWGSISQALIFHQVRRIVSSRKDVSLINLKVLLATCHSFCYYYCLFEYSTQRLISQCRQLLMTIL
jgi:hypothetical protein